MQPSIFSQPSLRLLTSSNIKKREEAMRKVSIQTVKPLFTSLSNKGFQSGSGLNKAWLLLVARSSTISVRSHPLPRRLDRPKTGNDSGGCGGQSSRKALGPGGINLRGLFGPLQLFCEWVGCSLTRMTMTLSQHTGMRVVKHSDYRLIKRTVMESCEGKEAVWLACLDWRCLTTLQYTSAQS